MSILWQSHHQFPDGGEGGQADAAFVLEDGATSSNVITSGAGVGIQCVSSCTLVNIQAPLTQTFPLKRARAQKRSQNEHMNSGSSHGRSPVIL